MGGPKLDFWDLTGTQIIQPTNQLPVSQSGNCQPSLKHNCSSGVGMESLATCCRS